SGQVTTVTFSVKVTVGGQTGIALIDTGSSSQLTSGAIIADTAFCFLVFQRSRGAEEFLVEKGQALANPSIPTLEKKKPIFRHLLPSGNIII
uniref:Uncharacterized protein n=1 Tax=Setaria italica TaxID=4555 RepID=K3YLR2_SETIT